MLKSVSLSGVERVDKGASVASGVTVLDSLGRPFVGAAVSYASQNTAVATVDSSGKVTGVAPGTAKVTVTAVSGKVTVSSDVTVTVVDTTKVRIMASADGHVQSSTATTVFGGDRSAWIKAVWLGSPDRTGYAVFDLSQLAGRKVTSAVLSSEMVVTEDRSGQDVSRVDAHVASGVYSESSTTYQNRPQLGATIGSFVVDRTKRVLSADVTSGVASYVAGSPGQLTLGFTQDDAGAAAIMVNMSTREAGVPAYLDITLDPAPAAQVPG